MLKLFCALAVTLQCLSAAVVAVQPLEIISIVSNSSSVGTPLWGRGEELIPGALLAAQEVNSNEDVLNGFHIEVVPLFVQDCSVSEGILKTVQELLSTDHPVIGVINLFCPRLGNALSPLLGHKKISFLGSPVKEDSISKDHSSDIFSILPGIETQKRVLFQLMKALNWRSFNIVSIRSKTPLEDLYTEIVEAISDNMKTHSVLQLDRSAEQIIQALRQSTARIVVAALPSETAADLLCRAFENTMTWPRYAWIMLDLTVSESARCGGESLLRAMENVIVLRTKLVRNETSTLVSNVTYSNYVQRVKQHFRTAHNPYTNVLYDSVWALALAVNSSLQMLQYSNFIQTPSADLIRERLLQISFAGASGAFKNGQIQILQEIYQIQKESYVLFGQKHFSDNVTQFQLDKLAAVKPQDGIPSMYQLLPVAVTVTISVGIGLCIVFVTAVLILFLCYWRQPEVRATSRALSLCIFLGCYLLLASALGTSVSWGVYVEPGVPVCVITVGGCFIGIDLILATVLAKTLRIAYVFTEFKKIGKACSDIVLLAMIAGIVSGKIIILVLWNAIDFYNLVDLPELSTDDEGLLYYKVFQECSSQHLEVWLLLVLAYSTIVGIPLLILAYRTRKIKRGHFKDTKKINGLLVSLVVIGSICVPLWGIFYYVEMFQASTYVATVGYTAIAIMCQVFLFVPKIWPGLKKSFTPKMKKISLLVTTSTSNS